MAAQMMQIRLNRHDAQPWGFRLQGGLDFGTPLLVQKVNVGSIADNAGLRAGDAVLQINNMDVYNLRHKDAQDIVVRSGNTFDVTVQRGGSTWRPLVTPTGSLPSPGSQLGNNVHTVTRTSLVHRQPEARPIGTGYNNAARPYNSVNGDGHVKSIVNKQYNTPVGIYSEESIAETLSAQAEVLAGGVLGVNFKKNEKIYNPEGSEVLKALQEHDNEPEPAYQSDPYSSPYQQPPQQQHYRPSQPSGPSVTQHVTAPYRPGTVGSQIPNAGGLPTGQNICAECERLIVGVFVRIKDRNLHAECFRCATCGTSLRNQGYYNFKNKLYCEIHAKQAAMQNPPPGTEGYFPLPIKPTAKISAGAISAALRAHHPGPDGTSNGAPHHPIGGSPSGNVNSNYGGPRPFNQGPMSPHAAGPRSPSSYPPPSQAPAWTQPRPATNPYATLPRTGQSHGRHLTSSSSFNQGYNTYNRGPSGPSAGFTGPSSGFTGPSSGFTGASSGFAGASSGFTGSSSGPGANKSGAFGATSIPKRGRGTLNRAVAPGVRVPICGNCSKHIRGPFITALGQIWCPEHFICVNASCRRSLQDIGFVEEKGDLYCEYCFEKYLAPSCSKCNSKIKGDCLNAIGRHFHPECFTCAYCGKLFGNSPFFLEDGQPYCENDWNELFTTKCFACGYPVEAGDRWVEALNHNYHSQCFNCTFCKQNLEGQSFYNKGGRPFCKNHAR